MNDQEPEFDAVLLAGGRARRLGGADKPGVTVGGRSLIARVAAAAAGAGRLVVVGPARPELPHAVTVREDPPGAGPVPALRAGLAEVRAPWAVLLAADLPFLGFAEVTGLRRRARTGTGAVLVDDGGREQWLAGCWRTDVLRAALAGYQGASLHGLLSPLDPVRLATPAGERAPWLDCDTPEAVERARRLAGRAGRTVVTAEHGPRPARRGGMIVLEDWLEVACRELGLKASDVDRDLVLDLARDVAHGVARPAAPLTAYLLGLAVGRGEPARDAAARITELAEGWAADPDPV
ncbi:DUF6457 domain-containing protein [Actinomadura craniellae]|uniref:DUF6457 domain-containing protein n=1 Tax=Actinomadura craniellae TaxID=2231787 RepID=UPI0026955F18|nr:DUF6457 domain-containing protein [Actinomadura craniellae]